MQRKQNNAGFSLVEVVLSMAILAIISIPLLNYFSDSMKYNAKMADKQHATVLAQEVLENLKNQDKLVQKDPVSAKYTVPYLVYTSRYLLDDASNTLDNPGGGEGTFVGSADSIGQKYDVVVKVKTDTAENNTAVTQVDSIDDTCDLMAVEGGQCQEALVHFKAVNAAYVSNHGGSELNMNDIKSKMVRTIGIDIQLDGAYYAVKVTCSYACKDLQGTGSTDTYTCTPIAESRLQDIRRVYLLFQVAQDKDYVKVTRGTGVSKIPELYLVCQSFDTVPIGYTMSVTEPETMLVYTNVGKKSKPDQISNNPGTVLNADGEVKELYRQEKQMRKIDIEVSVYKKGKANTGEPYITVNTTKGE